MKRSLTTLLLLVSACQSPAVHLPRNDSIDLNLATGVEAMVVVDGLMNPSCVTFHPAGHLTVCDSGNGRVLLFDGKTPAAVFATGFATEHWKVDAEAGTRRFLLGPLSAVWIDDGTLAVTDAGQPDGEEKVLFFDRTGECMDERSTNAVGPTTDNPADKGEGNLTGMCTGPDGLLYVCGQGSDAKSWVLRADPRTGRLETFASADEHGIDVNSPMQVMPYGSDSVLVLYSGAGGKPDGTLVEWSIDSAEPLRQWSLLGLDDPMGMARMPGTNELAIVDNNWSLTEVRSGRLGLVTLPELGGMAEVRIVAEDMQGPVSCAFGPDGRLYVACLGEQFDAGLGYVVAILF